MTMHIPVICGPDTDLFELGQTIVMTIIQQTMAQGMPPELVARLAGGLFSGSMATLQTLEGDHHVRVMFDALLSANGPAGAVRPTHPGH